jgi:hypothetical protein
MIRGAIVPLISKKTLYLPGEIANETAALTLMSTDVQGLTSGITRFHDIWVSFIEICIGIFLLSIAVGDAIYLVFIPVIGKKGRETSYATLTFAANHYRLQRLQYSRSSSGISTSALQLPGMQTLSRECRRRQKRSSK